VLRTPFSDHIGFGPFDSPEPMGGRRVARSAGQTPPTETTEEPEFLDVMARSPRQVGKLLREPFLGRYSARRGEYRVIYSIDDEQSVVHALDVAHRRDVSR
jgi:mRNA-degrading endonuclease RelE of RelBE toxin-antitoxin system